MLQLWPSSVANKFKLESRPTLGNHTPHRARREDRNRDPRTGEHYEHARDRQERHQTRIGDSRPLHFLLLRGGQSLDRDRERDRDLESDLDRDRDRERVEVE